MSYKHLFDTRYEEATCTGRPIGVAIWLRAALLAVLFVGLFPAADARALQQEQSTYSSASAKKLETLLGIYESVAVSENIPGAVPAAPAKLDTLPLTPAATTLQAQKKIEPDPKDLCQVLGPFRLMARPGVRFELLQDPPNKLVMLFENGSWGYLRTIRIDSEHIQDFSKVRPMWNGDSIAHWDGETLVIDTVHFTDKTWLNENGLKNSKKLHLSESIRVVDRDRYKYIEYRAMATDPEVLAKPVSYVRYFRRSQKEISEYDCYAHKVTEANSDH